jgi:hypothetical protein
MDGLVGFHHPSHYDGHLIKPSRNILDALIVKEWPNYRAGRTGSIVPLVRRIVPEQSRRHRCRGLLSLVARSDRRMVPGRWRSRRFPPTFD